MAVSEGDHRRYFRFGLAGYLSGLVVQFWLGMWVNLFVTVPKNHPGANPAEYFSGVLTSVGWAVAQGPSIWLAVHAVLGLILGLGAIALLVRAVTLRSRGLIVAMALGAVGVVGSGFNGGSFLNYHEDFSSMLMASGFAVAAISYTYALAIAP